MLTDAISSLVNNTVNSIVGGIQTRKARESQEAMNASNLASQDRINQANLANQTAINTANINATKEINQANLNNQNYWNQVTMDREDNAYQRAAKDIQAAGLSKALLNGGASATPLSTANQVAPVSQATHQDAYHGTAYTGSHTSEWSGDTFGGLASVYGALQVKKLINNLFGGKRDGSVDGSKSGSTATVQSPTGDVEVSFVSGNSSNGYTPHYNTRSVQPQKFVASPITADSVGFSNVATSNTLKSSVPPDVQTGIANCAQTIAPVLSPSSKDALAKYLKLTTVTADDNVSFDSKYGGELAYKSQVPKMMEGVISDLVTGGVCESSAEAQMYVKNLAYTVHSAELPNPSKETLNKALGTNLFPNHYGAQRIGYYRRNFSGKSDSKYYIKGGANGAKYKSHD